MSERLKLVIIGGGSSYTPEFINRLIQRKKKLPIGEIWLVDVEIGYKKVEIISEFTKRMLSHAGLDWNVYVTLDRRKALKNADFVATQFRVGGINTRILDERIPLSHGLIGQETNGAGGIFKALRTIPVIVDIAKDMKSLCPNAWWINFTNPSGIVTQAIIKEGKWERVVGLCNVPLIHKSNEAAALNTPEKDLFFKFAGIDHFHWHRVWDKKGDEVTNKLIDILYHHPDPDKQFVQNIDSGKYTYEQIKDLGILPCEYHRYYYATDYMLEGQLEDYKNNQVRAQVVKKIEKELFNIYKKTETVTVPKELKKRGGAHYSDAACEAISSIYNNEGKIMVVSTRNNGAISDLPDDTIVEVSAKITSHGVEPIAWGKFSPAPRAFLQLMKGMEEETIDAALSGNYGTALQAFTLNPLVQSGHTAQTVLNELLIAHKSYLPNFEKVIGSIENGAKKDGKSIVRL